MIKPNSLIKENEKKWEIMKCAWERETKKKENIFEDMNECLISCLLK